MGLRLQLGHVLSNMVSIQSALNTKLKMKASIGPCPFKHGKELNIFSYAITHTLQLGHVLSNMVSDIKTGLHDEYWLASIGPCPFKHGKKILNFTVMVFLLLQLGHVLSNMVRTERFYGRR